MNLKAGVTGGLTDGRQASAALVAMAGPSLFGRRIAILTTTGVLVTLAVIESLYGWFGPPGWRYNLGDYNIYLDAARRLLTGGSWYLDRQLHGPYTLAFGDVLYPPTTAYFFALFLVLPAILWFAIPVAATAWAIWRMAPATWAWPLMAACLLWPMTPLKAVSGNPNLWVMAAIAIGCLYRWPFALVLLKPSLLPLAFLGAIRRSWWGTVALLALITLPVIGPTLDYPRVLADAQGGGLLYSLSDVPMLLIPLAAWVGRRKPMGTGRRST